MRINFKVVALCFGLLGLGAGMACTGTGPVRIDATCEDYCAKAKECSDGVDVDDCVDSCKEQIGDCMADEQEQALDDLDSCAADSCDDFLGCTIGAGIKCTFGI